MLWRNGARSVVLMRHHHHITTRTLATTGLICAALAAPAPAVVVHDPANVTWTPATRAAVDLRSPDARDAGQPTFVDMRSPDAATPVVLPEKRPIVAPHATPADSGFDTTSALIGAAIAALLAMGAVVLVRTRRHHMAPLGS